ncbi:hypothetical protein ACFL3C_02755 [Patescibacteria group bacterium]
MATAQNNSKFKTSTLIGLVLIVVAVVGIFLFLMPVKGSFDAGGTNLLQKQTQLNGLKTKLSSLQAVESSFKGSEVTQIDVLNYVPESIEQGNVIKALAKLADDNEVSLNSLSFSLGLNRELDINTLTVTTNISGKHQSLIEFIEGLETNGRKFNIKNLSVQTLENRLENISLTIEAFSL